MYIQQLYPIRRIVVGMYTIILEDKSALICYNLIQVPS